MGASDARAARAAAARSASGSGAERERQLTMGHCHAVGCAEVLATDRLFCERHEAMLWPDVRDKLYRKFRPGKKPSKVFLELLDRALFGILGAQQLGHRVPRAQDFEWTDDVPSQPGQSEEAPGDRASSGDEPERAD